ncbi:MAG: hypothetical protein ACRDWI_13650 [Jiangellaceae bacterium]
MFSGSGSGEAGNGPTVSISREVSFDPATCTRDFAVASYAAYSVPAQYVDDIAESATDEESVSDGVTPYYSWTGQLKVNVEDPLQIDVSSTRSKVQWSGSSCATSSYHNAYWSWFEQSGWRRYFDDWSYGRNCSRAYTNTLGKYYNYIFCTIISQPSVTYTDHKKTWFEGRPGGRYYWSYSVGKSGGCTNLLHYERIVTSP